MKFAKLRLLSLVALALGVSTLVTFFSGNSVHAVNGSFKWIDATTIEADNNYSADGNLTFKGKMPTFTSQGQVSQPSLADAPVKGCTFNATITVNQSDTTKGSIKADEVNNTALDGCGMYKDALNGDITIANPEKGPKAFNYATANCADPGQNSGDQARCDTIKKCIVNGKQGQDACVAAYDTCMTNHTVDGKVSDADKKTCQDLVSQGKLDDANKPAGTKTSCAIEGIGWLVCPVVNFLAKVTDASYSFVSSLLQVQPLNVSNDQGSLYFTWSIMRNFANVAFVIAFLIIIFSQVSGVGITNYGIKKMLPRLIVAAVLVNVSYWVCALAVDLSNILGSSINGLFANIKDSIPLADAKSVGATGDGWAGIAGAVLVGAGVVGAALYVGLSALLPALLLVVATIIAVVVVLVLRQAIIILLVVVSPLAFVAYLLPNTENLFKKWRSLFQTMLIMYPAIGLLFGASGLAEKILMSTAGDNIGLKIVAASASVLPLIATITLIKGMHAISGKVFGAINNPNKGPYDRLRKKATGYAGYRKNVSQARRLQGTNMFKATGGRITGSGSSRFRRMAGGAFSAMGAPGAVGSLGARAGLTGELKRANAEKAVSQAKQEYVADRVTSEMRANNGQSAYAQTIAGPTGDAAKIQAAAVAAQRAEISEAIKNAQTTMRAEIPPGNIKAVGDALADAIRENNSIKAQAAQNILMSSGGKGLSQYRDTMTEIGNQNPELMANQASTDMRHNMLENHGGVKGSAADFIAQASSGKTMGEASNDPGTWKLSDSEMVRQKGPSIELAINSGGLDKDQATRIIGNEELAQHLPSEEIREKVRQVANRTANTTQAHEEALVQNQLYDMENRNKRP